MRKRVQFAAVAFSAVGFFAGLAVWATSQWHGNPPPDARQSSGIQGTQGQGLEGVGVVRYDPSGPADTFLGNIPNVVGNVFDSGLAGPLETGSVSQLAAYFGGSDATFPYLGVIELSPFNVVSLPGVSGLVPFTFNTIPLPAATSVSNPFLGGVLVSAAFTSSADSVGMQSSEFMGNGFHAASLPYGGPAIPLGNFNAMVRVSGSIWVPVELMSVDVE